MGKKAREKKERRKKIEKGEITVPKKEKPEIRPVAICKGIIFIGTGLALFTPLIVSGKFFFPFVGPKSIYFMGLAEIIFATWLILQFFSKKYRPKFNIILWAIVLFVAVLALSSVLGADISRSIWSKYERMTGLLMWFHLLAFFLVISSSFKKKSDWFKIFSISSFVAVLISFLVLGPKIGVDFLKGYPTREGATIGNSSFLGTYLLFNFFLVLYLLFKTKKGLRIYSGISLAIISLALFSIGARAASISTLGGLVLLFLLWMIFRQKIKVVKVIGVILLIVFASGSLGTMYLALRPGNYVYKEMTHMATKSRLVVWQAGWKGFLEKPWFGWGPENFELAFIKHFDPRLSLQEYGGEVWFDRAHNIVVDTLVASGIIGFLGYALIFFSTFYILWRKYFREKIDFWLVSIISVALIAYVVQNLTVFDMVNSYLMWFLVLGFVSSIAARSFENQYSEIEPPVVYSERGRWPRFSKLSSAIILILFGFSFFEFVIQPLKADAYVIKAIRTKDSASRVSLYKEALKTSPVGRYQIREFFADNTVNFFFSKDARNTPKEDLTKEFDFVSSKMEESTKESPLDFRAYLKLGRVYDAWSMIDKSKIHLAEQVLSKAIELSPRNQQAYWFLAQAKLNKKDNKAALDLAKEAVSIEPRLLQSHKILIQVAHISKDKKKVKEFSQRALKVARQRINDFPGNVRYYRDAIYFAQLLGDKEKAKEIAQKAVKVNPVWESQFRSILSE